MYFNQTYVTTTTVVDGSINVDRTQSVRRQGVLTVGDPLFFPTFATSPLAPYGAELHVGYQVTYPGGAQETCPLGVFVIRDVYEEQSTGGLPVVDFRDRSSIVSSYPFLTPYDASGVQLQALVQRLVQAALPYVTVTYAPALLTPAATTYVTGGTTFSSDRWSAVQSLCGMIGAEAYFDVFGNVQVVPIPALTQAALAAATPVWNFNAGPGGVLITAKRTVTRDGVYNAVYGTGGTTGSAGATVTAFASDNDPRSPTYYGPIGQLAPDPASNFGPQVLQYSNSMISTTAALQTAVNAQLQNYLGLARNLNYTALPNPALEAGDIVRATYSPSSYELHVADSFVVPLGPSASFTGQTRTATYQLSAGS